MLPAFIKTDINPADFFVVVSNRNIGFYILDRERYRLVFGSSNVSDQDIKNIVGSWKRFAKPLFVQEQL